MTKKELAAAVKKYTATKFETRDALLSALEDDEMITSKEDAEQVLTALDEAINFPASDKKNDQANGFDVSEFDYKNLVGADFRRYISGPGDRVYTDFDKETGVAKKGVVGSLRLDDMYYFQLFRVDVIRTPRFPGMRDSPIDFRGVKVKDDKPVHTTKIPVRTALEYNAQIENAHSVAGHGKYYLLKK